VSTTLLPRWPATTYLRMRWTLTSQLHGSFLKESTCFFVTDQTPCPHPTTSLPTQFRLSNFFIFVCLLAIESPWFSETANIYVSALWLRNWLLSWWPEVGLSVCTSFAPR
jgi:hypothetical protein